MRHLATLALLFTFGLAYGEDKPDCDPSSGLAIDASCLEPQPSADSQSGYRSDDDAARTAFSSRNSQYCARTAKSEHELGDCLGDQAHYAERELNETYKKVMTQLSTAQRNALRREERKWIKWREAECARQAKDVEECVNGCGVPWTMRLVCMTEEAHNRVDELKAKWSK